MMFTKILSRMNGVQNKFASHILLYHATYQSVPKDLKNKIHNVAPEILYEQIKWVKKYFDIVKVDDLFIDGVDVAGKAAITFDDAYESVFQEAVPVLDLLKVPSTIFVNGISFSRERFWRDKIRLIINNSLIEDFLEFSGSFATDHNITCKNFYTKTKQLDINSSIVDRLLDQFIDKRNIQMHNAVDIGKKIVKHPLVSYGNHSFHHYVLSSLTAKEQEQEIAENDALLKSLKEKFGIELSRVFSIPFGEDKDFDTHTLRLLTEYNYIGFLYSRRALNFGRCLKGANNHGVTYRERYMLPTDFDSFQKEIFRLATTRFRCP